MKVVGVVDYEIFVINFEDGIVQKILKSKLFGMLIIYVNFYMRDGKFVIFVVYDNIICFYDFE